MGETSAKFNFYVVILLYLSCHCATNAFECGNPKHSEGFIIGGTYVNHGDYPWIAALVNLNNKNQKFFCGGTLITNSHVMTAAHCIHPKNIPRPLLPKDIAVLLGKHNLNVAIEVGSMAVYISQIYVHPDWRTHTNDYDADIAILKLQQVVTFSEYILPICWPSRADTEAMFEGTVTGWGASENEDKILEEIPKEIQVESITNEACFLDDYLFAIISSRRTFCAGMENAGPCLGDSGGGLIVRKNNRWTICGIVSSSFLEKGKCDTTKYAVYTSVIKFSDWARDILSRSIVTGSILDEIIEPDIGEDTEFHITIDCAYGDEESVHAVPVKKRYTCFVGNFDTPRRLSIAHIHGKHRERYSNQDVEEFLTIHKEFPYIPMGIGKIFPNLEMFFVGEGSHLKSIERKNFEGMSKVTSLFLGYNDLEILPKDGFYELFSLEALFIDNNKLKSVHRDLLVKMSKLKKFIAYNNQIEYLDVGIFRRNAQLKYITLRNNKLKTIGVNFKQLRDIEFVNVIQNSCIDTQFPKNSSLDEFQDMIDKKCKGN